MFWKNSNPIRVELINPPTIIAESRPASTQERDKTPEGDSRKILTRDQFFKLAAVMVAFANTALVVLGYMAYAGVLETFDIGRTEVSFSVSDLLAFGYVEFLNMPHHGQLSVAATSAAAAMPVVALVVRFMDGLNVLLQLFLIWLLLLVLFFVLTGPYWFAYNPVKQRTLGLVATQLNVDPSTVSGLDTNQEIWTDSGFLTGVIVLAMPDVTYLLKGDILYKIRGSDGKVVRKTHIKARITNSHA